MENITTIQLRENVKKLLEKLKERKNESYEDVIVKLIHEKESRRENFEKLLREECEEMSDEYLKTAKEWESTLLDGLDPDEKWKEYEYS